MIKYIENPEITSGFFMPYKIQLLYLYYDIQKRRHIQKYP